MLKSGSILTSRRDWVLNVRDGISIVLLSLLVGASTDVTNLEGDHMTRLHQSFRPVGGAVPRATAHDPGALRHGRTRRASSLMRRYEAAALLADLSISFQSHVAPANALFEEATTAFARGTLLPTVRGSVAIEDLLPGDYVESSEGAQPVTWIGSTSYVPGIEDDATTLALGDERGGVHLR